MPPYNPWLGFPMPICTATVANLALSQQQKSQIAEATAASHSAQIVDTTADDVRIYLPHIPATQRIEFGRFLPEPGDKAKREKGMTLEKRAGLPNTGSVPVFRGSGFTASIQDHHLRQGQLKHDEQQLQNRSTHRL